jgi:hypothetical protein
MIVLGVPITFHDATLRLMGGHGAGDLVAGSAYILDCRVPFGQRHLR